MKSRTRRPSSGFTMTEILVAMTIGVMVVGLTLNVFLTGLRTMYKDQQRLATNTALRVFTTQVAKETLDSTEFYVFPSYATIDGNITLASDYSDENVGEGGTYLFHGDCLVLVTRVSTASDAKVRQFRVYYRVPRNTAGTATPTNPNNAGPIRYYESADYGEAGTDLTLKQLLDAIPMHLNPNLNGSRQVVERTRGRLRAGSTTDCYPIFSTESATVTPTNDSVSINVEIITGTTVNNLLSSSSFNYTISPRR